MADRDATEMPPGWRADGDTFFFGRGHVYASIDRPGEWRWRGDGPGDALRGYAPTMLQAMCAALGIRYAQDAISGNYYATCAGSPDLVRDEQRIKSWKACARAALEAFHARQQHPTTPTPEPVASVGEVTAEQAREALGDAHAAASPARRDRGFMVALRYIAQTATPRSEIADLRGKLERAERERDEAHKTSLKHAERQIAAEDERDAATSRATELARRLAEVCDAREHGIGRVIVENRAYLSTLPGSKETDRG